MSTIHEMKLQPKFFDFIKSGTKRIELRLYDEKRRNIELGDKIIFKKEPKLEEVVETTVVGLLRVLRNCLKILICLCLRIRV